MHVRRVVIGRVWGQQDLLAEHRRAARVAVCKVCTRRKGVVSYQLYLVYQLLFARQKRPYVSTET